MLATGRTKKAKLQNCLATLGRSGAASGLKVAREKERERESAVVVEGGGHN